MSVPWPVSVRAQVLCVLRRWDVAVGVALEGGSEILLVVGVVYAVLGLVPGETVHRAVGGEREDGRGRDLVEVLGSRAPVVEADQVLGSSAVRWDGRESAAGRTGILVDGIHHVGGPVLVHVV